MGYSAGKLLVLGLERLFQPYAIHQQFWKYSKVQKFMNQHNFEMIHFKCIIPAIQCIIPVLLCYVDTTLEFKVHASKRRLRWKNKNNMRHVH